MGARLINKDVIDLYMNAGFNPKTGKPYRGLAEELEKGFKQANIKLLSVIDEQQAINSIVWRDLPKGLYSNLIERILYHKGQGMLFYLQELDQYFFLPYALNGTIDVYGRFTRVTPLPYHGSTMLSDETGEAKIKPWIDGLYRNVIYDKESVEAYTRDTACVLLHDYSPAISQNIVSREIINKPLIDLESDMIPFMRTALLNSTGVTGMRVASEDESSNVRAASKRINTAALNGEKFVATVGQLDFQELTGGTPIDSSQFLLCMQAIDNYRLQMHGLDSGGLFQKQAHMLESENAMNASRSSLVMADRLLQRKEFCERVNAMFGLNISVEISDSAKGIMEYNSNLTSDVRFEDEEREEEIENVRK